MVHTIICNMHVTCYYIHVYLNMPMLYSHVQCMLHVNNIISCLTHVRKVLKVYMLSMSYTCRYSLELNLNVKM